MNNWRDFLRSCGADFPEALTVSFGQQLLNGNTLDIDGLFEKLFLVPLLQYGVLSLTGPETRQFLQGQATCDITDLNSETSLLGAHCTPQGKIIGNFRLLEIQANEILLIAPRPIIPILQKSLERYAVFSKTQLEDKSDDLLLLGLIGNIAGSYHTELGLPDILENDAAATEQSLTCIRVSTTQLLLVVPKEKGTQIWGSLIKHAQPAGSDLWEISNIRRGFGEVLPQTSTMFIPQMLNLQAVGAISFRKGCYTGQEVVARTKYRGALRRRMYRFQAETDHIFDPGSECRLSPDSPSIGNLVTAVRFADSCQEILLVLSDETFNSTELIIGTSSPFKIRLLPLPYSVDDAA